MRHVPWFSLAATVVFFITPLGQSMLESAFTSGERLSNDIAQFMLMVVAGIVAALTLLEWGIKYFIRRRRARLVARG